MDYLAKQQTRPFQSHLSIADICCTTIAPKAEKFVNEADKINPEQAAIWFYLQNHTIAAMSRQWGKYEPLPGEALELVNQYHKRMNYESLRMFFYLLLICTRESRHIKNLKDIGPQMTQKYGTGKLKKFTNGIKGGGSNEAVFSFYHGAPEASLGDYCSYMYDLFNEGNWNGGYGGQAWADVSKVLRDFVLGTTTAEMMMDTAFTLAHNNGPIFNKGLVYNMYDGYEICKILDVQRAGQIPQLVANNETNYTCEEQHDYQEAAAALLGSEMAGHVDWYAVERLGAQQSYANQKAQQVQKFGLPQNVAIAEKMKVAKAAAEKAEKAKTHYTVMDGIVLKKLTRKEIAQ